MANRLPKAYFSELEAARSLGISVEDFRTLVRRHITDREEDLSNVSVTTYHAADLLVLRLLAGGAIALAAREVSSTAVC